MANLLDELNERILIGDGATGTYLYSLGIPLHHCLEEANIKNPDLVTRVYREYLEAGARIIETNSFGANRVRLSRYGLEHQLNEINWKAARLARDAARNTSAYVAGSVGPLSARPTEPPLSTDDQRSMFREQIGALLDGGCDLIFLETFSDLNELLLALDVFQNLTNIPVATSLAVSEEGRLTSGEDIATAFKKLREARADICSLNGTCGPQACIHLLSQIEIDENSVLAVYPNAGKPEFYEGRFNYAASPEYFARNLSAFVQEGARLIGGDYGTTPAHVAAMAAVAPSLQPVRSKPSRRSQLRVTAPPSQRQEPEKESSLLDKLAHKIVNIVELDSPKTLSMEKFLTGAKALKDAGVDAITLADNSLAILRVSNFAAAVHLREKIGITPLLHLACRDRNLLGIQSELMGLGTLGFRHILALTGDPAKVGDHPGASSVYDLNSVGLIKLIKQMNNGVNAVGRNLQGKTDFIIGCAFNANSVQFDSQVRKLESKIAAGAQYILTQPIFDVALVKKTAERLKPLGIPVFIGVMPLLHSRNAEFLHNEVPGISIPEAIREKLRHADEKSSLEIGIGLAKEVRRAILEHFKGVYIITPFLRYEISARLMENN